MPGDREAKAEDRDLCARCGATTVVIIARRLPKISGPGHVTIVRCESCGHFGHYETPQHAPNN